MATLQEQLQYAVDTKELIRQAIVNKGVEVPQDTVFRKYPDKINEISAEFNPIWSRSTGGGIAQLNYLKDALVIPTEINGQPLSTNFTYSGTSESFWNVKKIIFPEYFISVSLSGVIGLANVNKYSHLEELEINAETIAWGNFDYAYYMRYLKGITLTKFLNTGEGFKPNLLTDNPVSSTFFIKAPAMQRMATFHFGTASHPVELTLDMPNLVTIGGNNADNFNKTTAQYCTGEWEFPKVTLWFQWATPHGEQTLKLPGLVEQRWETSFSNTDTGILHLYIGPKCRLLQSAANFKAHEANLDIHIPAGESTTKATLDAAGLAYTQDYVI